MSRPDLYGEQWYRTRWAVWGVFCYLKCNNGAKIILFIKKVTKTTGISLCICEDKSVSKYFI